MNDAELVAVGPGREGLPNDGDGAGHGQASATREASEARDASEARESTSMPRATATDLEALLFVAERPLSRAELRAVTELGAEDVDELLGNLEVELRERGIRLVSSGDQVMLATSPESGRLIARYLGADALRLSPAALETLAIVAYRQPVTRGVIERIRGVDCGHVVRGLLHRRLLHEQGRADSPGRPILYATSMEFMERFGLTSLDDLPPLEADVAARLAQAEVDQATEAEGTAEVEAATDGRAQASTEPAPGPDDATDLGVDDGDADDG